MTAQRELELLAAIAKMREALITLRDNHRFNVRSMTATEVHSVCFETLSLPTDDTALRELIAKAGEVMRERCERVPDRVPIRVGNAGIWGVEVFKEIRALPGVSLEDLK